MHTHKCTPGGIWKVIRQEIRWEERQKQQEMEGRWDEDGKVERWRKGDDKGTEREGIKCADGGTVVVKLRKRCDVLNKTTLSSPPVRHCHLPSCSSSILLISPSQSLPLLPLSILFVSLPEFFNWVLLTLCLKKSKWTSSSVTGVETPPFPYPVLPRRGVRHCEAIESIWESFGLH